MLCASVSLQGKCQNGGSTQTCIVWMDPWLKIIPRKRASIQHMPLLLDLSTSHTQSTFLPSSITSLFHLPYHHFTPYTDLSTMRDNAGPLLHWPRCLSLPGTASWWSLYREKSVTENRENQGWVWAHDTTDIRERCADFHPQHRCFFAGGKLWMSKGKIHGFVFSPLLAIPWICST